MEQVSQTQVLLDRVQGLVWLSQALTQADTEITQEVLDRVQGVIGLAQNCSDTLDSERNELDRVLVQSSLSTLASGGDRDETTARLQRQTVDERDSFLSGLNEILKLSEH